MWNITYLGPAVSVQYSKTVGNLTMSDVNLDPEWAKCENTQFRQAIESVIRLVYWYLEIWNITCVSARVTVKCPKKMCNLSHFTCNSAPAALFYKRSGNRQCHNGLNGDDLARFRPDNNKSWFIMATSQCNFAIVNQNFIGIGPNSAISDQIRQYRSDCAHWVLEGLQSAC